MSLFKWALGLLGAYIAGLPGGLLGYWLGSKLDKRTGKQALEMDESVGSSQQSAGAGQGSPEGIETDEENLKDTDICLVLLIAAVMKADSNVRLSELNAVKRFLVNNYDEADAKKILRLLREMVKPSTTIELEAACDVIRKHTDYTTRYHMVDFLFRLAMADAAFDGRENKTIQSIARHLNITQGDYVSMFSRHTAGAEPRRDEEYKDFGRGAAQEQRSKNPYSVLGITNGATDEAVKKAYRRMAMRYHPDKVENLGEEMKKNATEQFRAINEAYETIKTERGIN